MIGFEVVGSSETHDSSDRRPLCSVSGNSVRVEMYVWLHAVSSDCTSGFASDYVNIVRKYVAIGNFEGD